VIQPQSSLQDVNGRPFQRYISIRQAAAVVGSLHSVAVYWYYRNWGIFMPPPQGGIKQYRDPSVCLSHGAAALGYRHAGCLQLSQVRTADRPWTDVYPPRVELPLAGGISSRRSRGDNLFKIKGSLDSRTLQKWYGRPSISETKQD